MVFHLNLIHLYPSVENPKYPPADVEVTGWQAFSHRDTRDWRSFVGKPREILAHWWRICRSSHGEASNLWAVFFQLDSYPQISPIQIPNQRQKVRLTVLKLLPARVPSTNACDGTFLTCQKRNQRSCQVADWHWYGGSLGSRSRCMDPTSQVTLPDQAVQTCPFYPIFLAQLVVLWPARWVRQRQHWDVRPLIGADSMAISCMFWVSKLRTRIPSGRLTDLLPPGRSICNAQSL